MYRAITETLYCVKGALSGPVYVECERIEDLYEFVADRQVKGYLVTSVCRMDPDGSTPRIPILSNDKYRRVYARHRNFRYAMEKIKQYHCVYEDLGALCGRIYFSRESGAFATFGPCDDPRLGAVMIDGRVELIDDWLARLV